MDTYDFHTNDEEFAYHGHLAYAVQDSGGLRGPSVVEKAEAYLKFLLGQSEAEG